jgi:hypothetical protein
VLDDGITADDEAVDETETVAMELTEAVGNDVDVDGVLGAVLDKILDELSDKVLDGTLDDDLDGLPSTLVEE